MSLLNVSDLAFRFPATDDLFRDVSFEINSQDKIGLVGRNGAGKTSLLRVLAGELAPTAGSIVRRGGPRAEAEARRVLAGLGFAAQECDLSLSRLSSGQRARAALARGLLSSADLILLDEPTNHLDIEARVWLEDYLRRTVAACMVVSHDRAFLNGLARRILEIEGGRIRQFEGNYDEYRNQRLLLDRQAWQNYQAQQRRMAADAGEIRFGANVQTGYYAQESENLDPDRTPLEVCGAHTLARTLLACLKLHRDRFTQPMASLSAGERSKVALVRLLLSGSNLLLLDEPSNHLEIEAQEAVEQMLSQFPGTVLLVSHDRRFLESVTSRTVGSSARGG
jgi:ATPase subunit of ABC transporter with duplicated ATPase domains